jgi:phosphocarrier protein FPr
MVGIVVVSHSRTLAEAAVALTREMASGLLRVEVAAGLDEETFGTDAMAIRRAITAADDGAGVVVLMDVGSAVLSTDLALEMLDEDVRARVRSSAAPLIEGLLAAAVVAAGGASVDEVAAEAAAGLAGKEHQLGVRSASSATERAAIHDQSDRAAVGTFTVLGPHGLHARPGARLVREANRFDANVTIRNLTTGSHPVSARSLSRIATLGAGHGHELEIRAAGSDAEAALEALLALARRSFDESDGQLSAPLASVAVRLRSAAPVKGVAASSSAESDVLVGLPVSPGIGLGPARQFSTGRIGGHDQADGNRTDGNRTDSNQTDSNQTDSNQTDSNQTDSNQTDSDPSREHRRLAEAIDSVDTELRRLQARTGRDVGPAEASIFDAHLALLHDPELIAEVRERLDGERSPRSGTPVRSAISAEAAWAEVLTETERTFAALDDPHLRSRAADVRALRDQVLRTLLGSPSPEATGEGVLVAADLTPAEVAWLEPSQVFAIVLAFGSPTSHAAILARARDIPTVVAAGPAVLDVPAGTLLAVDGSTGEVIVAPDEARREEFRRRGVADARARSEAARTAAHPALTRDGLQILVGANVASVAEATAAGSSGADLAGLVRTEFLFLGRDAPPDVDEQVEAHLAIADALGGRRLTLRTLDVGGDKPLPYVEQAPESNPFLGVRGLRLSLRGPELFRDQLRAIVRTARQTPVSVMFPMVSAVEELVEVRRLLDAVIVSEGHGRPTGLEVGMMVEVPAAALKSSSFAPYVDFFSIGTNDLTQYALAAERGNEQVAALGDPYDPGVLALIRAVCVGAADGPRVAVCGELAGDPGAAGILIGLGVGELSVAPPAIPAVKQAIREIDSRHAEDLAATALSMPGPAAVRGLLAT